jgi:hypothetical protein
VPLYKHIARKTQTTASLLAKPAPPNVNQPGSPQLAQSLTIPRKIAQTELASRLSSRGKGHLEMR